MKAVQEQSFQQKQGGGGSSGGSRRVGGGRPPTDGGEDGWTLAAGSKTIRNTVDPTKFKLTKQTLDDNIQLCPGLRPSFGDWKKGSSGGSSRTSSQEAEKAPSNR